jgi:drug/metabolite transporter (DMT)-like permease
VYHLLAIVSVCARSVSPVLIRLLPNEVPSLLKMVWRLLLMTTMQAPVAIFEFRALSGEARARYWRRLPLICSLGFAVALNYGAYGLAVDNTSIAHALLLGSTAPLMLVCASLFSVGVASIIVLRSKGAVKQTVVNDKSIEDRAVLTSAAALSLVTVDDRTLDSADADCERVGGINGISHHVPVMPDITSERNVGVQSTLDKEVETRGEGDSRAREIHADPTAHAPQQPLATPSLARPVKGGTWRAIAMFMYGPDGPEAPSILEVVGTVVGFAATLALIAETPTVSNGASTSDAAIDPSFFGDAAAVAGAMGMAVFLSLTSRLRQGALATPAFLVMAPVNLCGALIIFAYELVLGETSVCCGGTSLAGVFASWRVFGVAASTALIPGMLGHALMGIAMRVVTPLEYSTLSLAGPVIG